MKIKIRQQKENPERVIFVNKQVKHMTLPAAPTPTNKKTKTKAKTQTKTGTKKKKRNKYIKDTANSPIQHASILHHLPEIPMAEKEACQMAKLPNSNKNKVGFYLFPGL